MAKTLAALASDVLRATTRPARDDVRDGVRYDGYLRLEDYGALGDGRSVALSGADGSIDWWCVPNLDSTPFFDRLLAGEDGGRFSMAPAAGPFTAERRYRQGSNVLEQVFTRGCQVALLHLGDQGDQFRPLQSHFGRRLQHTANAAGVAAKMDG